MSSQMTRTDFKTTGDTSRVSATHRREERRVISDGQVERVELEERDQEEYYYVESRDDIPPRRRFADGSESITMDFSTDDRLLGNTVLY
uniref:DUF1918 domain-containing protein n=1 Tax=Ascaris lumbricoides TaxID=6252 RepID=A0A0M3I9Q8_ASCLU